ncbi:hypothetical protein QCA50_007849 [Cerrena zonata]|uniref:DUF6534 domain-containing protein n=1 Tax=Cerrena zonata TaxID=2478898 RepID=A0AAW0G711_9APHY
MAVAGMATNSLETQAVDLLGGLVICFCFSYIFYGITLTQTYICMLSSKDDPMWIRIWVSILCFLETIHTAFSMRLLYYLVVLSFGSLEKLGRIDWSFAACVFTENVIVAMVDIFFIRRLWILSNHSYLLTVGTSILLAGRIGCHTAASGLALSIGVWEDLRASRVSYISVEVANGLAAAVDAIIALSLIYFLHRRRSGQDRTDGIVRWLMGYTINSGAAIMVVSLTIAITYAKVTESLLSIGLVIAISKIYVNSLLGSLNARRLFREINTNPTAPTSKSSHIELSALRNATVQPRPIQIYRDKTQITDAAGSRSLDIHVNTFEDDNDYLSHRKHQLPK